MESEKNKEINLEITQKIIKNGNGRYILIPKHIVDLYDIKGGEIAEYTLKRIIKK